VRTILAGVVLLLIVAPSARSQTTAVPRWEYGTLTLISAGSTVPIWNAGDTAAVLAWPREKDLGTDRTPRTIPQASSFIRTLNLLGEQGWELVAAERGSVATTYLFKRRRP